MANKYPADHKFGMKVPKGGSDCEKCKYRDGQMCRNEYFNAAVGKEIPAPVDEYCCDVFEALKKGKIYGKTIREATQCAS